MVASQFSMVGSQIQPASRRVTVLNTAREMEAASRQDQKEENKEPTRKFSEIPTRRGDTSTSARHVGSQDLILRPSPRTSSGSLSSLLPSSSRFFIVLSCRDLLVEKPPLGVSLMRQSDTRVVVCTCIRTRRLFSTSSQNVFSSRASKNVLILISVRRKFHCTHRVSRV